MGLHSYKESEKNGVPKLSNLTPTGLTSRCPSRSREPSPLGAPRCTPGYVWRPTLFCGACRERRFSWFPGSHLPGVPFTSPSKSGPWAGNEAVREWLNITCTLSPPSPTCAICVVLGKPLNLSSWSMHLLSACWVLLWALGEKKAQRYLPTISAFQCQWKRMLI